MSGRLANAERLADDLPRPICGRIPADPAERTRYWSVEHRKNNVRRLRQLEAEAVLGLAGDDLAALLRQFDVPELRRSDDFIEHCAAVLRERRRLLAVRDARGRFAREGGAK